MNIRRVDPLSYDDVRAFVDEENRESIALEYKSDWISGYKLARIMAAMAV